MDNNIWSRRSTNKLSLSTSNTTSGKDSSRTDSPRTFTPGGRFGATSSHGKSNPFAPGGGGALASPGGSSAFGLGSGAFASFGTKAAKTPTTETPAAVKEPRTSTDTTGKDSAVSSSNSLRPLKYTWTIWYRPPTSKNADYEKSITPLASVSSVESFWAVYTKLKRPSTLPTVSDYHIFRKGIRPVWEDDENKKGGKFIMRLKKGVADRYWEDLLLAIVGDQFIEASEEVTGAVLSVRNGEDVLSVWTKHDGGKNIRIRETIRRLLALPQDTNLVFKSHDASIAQRTALDEARKEKSANPGHLKRRDTLSEEPSLKAS